MNRNSTSTAASDSPVVRPPFPPELEGLRLEFAKLIPLLEADPDWYGSIYFERKQSRSFSANLKQTQRSDQLSMGVVFRIYDGYTLFEEATDELDPKQLDQFARRFSKKVQSHERPEHLKKRSYHPIPWKKRLEAALEKEITSQLPSTLKPNVPVHFGIRVQKDFRTMGATEYFTHLKQLVEQCKVEAPTAGLDPQELTFIQSRLNITQEDSIFADRESLMSQTLPRLSLSLTLMSGSDRTYCRVGGLGGWETVELPRSEIRLLLKDLKALKQAEKLTPGKYKVLFGPALTGVLAHEAFGHSQEGDTCARGRSKAWELHQSGELVGNQYATILNNPALFENGDQSYGAWGSYFFDEEGWLAQEQVLLDKGRLLPPMTNLTSALRLGIPRTANGKRESWAHGVYTRQTNTYFSAGNKTLAQLMTQMGNGFLATQPAGGMEDPKGMGIQVGISYLYEVKDGQLTGRVYKGPAGGDIQLTGYTPDVLNSIVGKSKIEFESELPDQAKHPFNDVGGCGKYHKEFVYAGCGGPYLLLEQVILG